MSQTSLYHSHIRVICSLGTMLLEDHIGLGTILVDKILFPWKSHHPKLCQISENDHMNVRY